MVNLENQLYETRCLMVHNDIAEQRGYTTDDSQNSGSCFAAKTVTEQVAECNKVINKVYSILKSLNIPVSSYDSELDDLKYNSSNSSDSLK